MLLALLLLGACNAINQPIGASTTVKTPENSEIEWPTYAPESISLLSDEQFLFDENYGVVPKYRVVYYDSDIVTNVSGTHSDLIDNKEELREFHNMTIEKRKEKGGRDEINEMYLIAYIKYFKISREAFEKAIEEDKRFCVSSGFYDIDPMDETWERPNPDIIYTFDNAIINAYYRRENPVVPEPGTYTTYGSCEEYLRAQP